MAPTHTAHPQLHFNYTNFSITYKNSIWHARLPFCQMPWVTHIDGD